MSKNKKIIPKLNIAIITPTYNEIGNIGILLTKLAEQSKHHKDIDFTCFVLDDSSPDGTADEAKRIAKVLKSTNFTCKVLIRKEKNGLGKAYLHGFHHILSEYPNIQYIVQMDADLSHNPVYVSSFIHQIKNGADFVVASRYIPGGGTPDWTLGRKILSKGGNLYTRLLLSNKISDYTGGYNAYKSSLLSEAIAQGIADSGYGFLIDLKYKSLLLAKNPQQIPIIFLDREHGQSKIPKSTLLKNFLLVLRLKLNRNTTR